jgi:hypothetical protein
MVKKKGDAECSEKKDEKVKPRELKLFKDAYHKLFRTAMKIEYQKREAKIKFFKALLNSY